MVRGLLRLGVGLGSEPDEGARTWPLWPCRSAPAPQSTWSAGSFRSAAGQRWPACRGRCAGEWPTRTPACPAVALLLAHCLAARPLPPAYGLGDGAKPPENRQNLPVVALHELWQDGAAMNESEKQFSFTRAASDRKSV